MKKPFLLIGGLVVVVVVLSVTRITLVNSIATHGIELVDLQSQIETYQKQNELLKEEYLAAASYTNITAKAKEQGFGPAKSQLNMAAPLPLAKR